jgi:thymidylate synthase (FAD)
VEVKIVAVSHPTNTDCQSAEEFIAYAARVSNPSNQNNKDTAHKLVGYLIKNKHWSPFEMVSVTLEIITTRDIARQILRHRSFAFQEFSQRYAEATNFVIREARLQDSKNRQNSIKLDGDDELSEWFEREQRRIISEQIEPFYKEALKRGIAKEQARCILPEGCTESKLYMAGTLRSWIHYIDLRAGHGTQAEHMDVAKAARELFYKEFPNVMRAADESSQ